MSFPELQPSTKEEVMLANWVEVLADRLSLWAYLGKMHGQEIYPEKFLLAVGVIINYRKMTVEGLEELRERQEERDNQVLDWANYSGHGAPR